MIPVNTKKPLIATDEGNLQQLPNSVGLDAQLKTEDILFNSAKQSNLEVGIERVIEEYLVNEFRVFYWLINVVDQTTGQFSTSMILAHHDGAVVDYTEYAQIGQQSVNFDVRIINGYVKLLGQAINNNQTVKIITQAIRI